MYILSFKTGHDPAACLLEDGKIVAAAEEERFVRIKHAADYFPEQALRFCLSFRKLKLDEVDYIVFAREKNLATFLKVSWYFLTRWPRNLTEIRYEAALWKVQLRGLWQALRGRAPYQQIFKKLEGRERKIYSFDHHLCHAASAYYGSGLEEAAILCMDGKGEAASISFWEGKLGRIKNIKKYGIFDSLGYLYSSFTAFLGFRINDGEYKVMGLAPYGTPGNYLDGVFDIGSGGLKIDTSFSLYPYSLKNLSQKFPGITKEYGEADPPQFNADLAATLQGKLEQSALWCVRQLLEKVQTKNLCLAGGVALNVKMNKFIWESGLIEKMWVQPAAGDMGNVLGAAWLMYNKIFDIRPARLDHLYLGPGYEEEKIEESIRQAGLKYKKVQDVAEITADFLVEGKIIAWFQGRSEFAPRALGARSVLANPRKAEMKEIINAKVKFRESFRPFCPSFLAGWGEKIFENYLASPYMVMSFLVKPEWQNKIPAVVHVDGTARPQEVLEDSNPTYARLIRKFYEKTGLPVVLNTSLNVKGEPIVNTPEEAIIFFRKTDVDYLIMGNYVVEK